MRGSLSWTPIGLILVFAVAAGAFAQPARELMMKELYLPDDGRTFQISSHHPTEGDAIVLKPGETRVLFDEDGPAVIQNMWFTLAPPSETPFLLRDTIVRMYWDGERAPSVETPFGDFFGCGFSRYTPWQSALLGVTSGGFYSYFPMPFRKHGRITITNANDYDITVFFHFLGQRYDSLPRETLYFHAQWRRENPTVFGQNYRFARMTGKGYFAGVTHYMQGYTKGDKHNFLEGDEYYYIDGEQTASVRGTGTEDYYQGAWYFRDGVFNAPYHGMILHDADNKQIACYRFHLRDRINFTKSLSAEIEHGQRIYNEAKVDYSSVAYWYQTEPHAPFEAMNPDRKPVKVKPAFTLPGAIEFEAAPGAIPYYVSTYQAGWSNDLAGLFPWRESGQSARMDFEVEDTGRYTIGANFIRNDTNGILQVCVDGEPVGDPVDTWSLDPKDAYLLCRNKAMGHMIVGELELTAGTHQAEVCVTGKNDNAKGYEAIIDCVTVTPVTQGPPATDATIATGNLSVDAIQHSPIGAQPDPDYVPDLPTVEHLRALKEDGLWAYEDYIAWGLVEPEEGQWDWSHHEEVYRRVTEAGLVYIPYIWCHFPPVWLRDDPRVTLMKDTVEGKECYIMSIYDPRTLGWYEHFYRALFEQFGDRLTEVYACLLGPYGEGNYPLAVVDWVVQLKECFNDRYYCGDAYALPAFRAAMAAKYADIADLNAAWHTDFADFEHVLFPEAITTKEVPSCVEGSPSERRRWLDFIGWYHGALLEFSTGSVDLVSRIFGADRVATKPGGNAGGMNPVHWGTYNPAYAKMAGQRGIVMQSADSHGAYWADKWTSTAYHFYGVPYRTEAAGGLDEVFFAKRTFVDACCGASRLFTYQIEEHLPAASKWIHLFTGERDVTDVALLAPTTIHFLNGDVRPAIDAGMQLRDLFAYDVLDELLVRDGAIGDYRVLIAVGCDVIDDETLARIRDWVEAGGILLWADAGKVETVAGVRDLWLDDATPEGTAMGRGHVFTCTAQWEGLSVAAARVVFEETSELYPNAAERLDGVEDGVWLADRGDAILGFNTGSDVIEREITWRGKKHTMVLHPGELVEVR